MESPFDILRIDPDASEAEIERAFRERVKETHPDQGGSTLEFRKVHAAREQILAGNTDLIDGDDLERGDVRTSQGADTTVPEDPRSHVEYLNFEVFEDHGWSLEDDDLFEKAADADLEPADYGHLEVDPNETLLEAAEDDGFEWPYACRGGACANCAVAMTDGDLSTPVDHILPEEMTDRGIRLSCVGTPTTEDATVVYNVKHLPELDELKLPPRPFD